MLQLFHAFHFFMLYLKLALRWTRTHTRAQTYVPHATKLCSPTESWGFFVHVFAFQDTHKRSSVQRRSGRESLCVCESVCSCFFALRFGVQILPPLALLILLLALPASAQTLKSPLSRARSHTVSWFFCTLCKLFACLWPSSCACVCVCEWLCALYLCVHASPSVADTFDCVHFCSRRRRRRRRRRRARRRCSFRYDLRLRLPRVACGFCCATQVTTWRPTEQQQQPANVRRVRRTEPRTGDVDVASAIITTRRLPNANYNNKLSEISNRNSTVLCSAAIYIKSKSK